ncbi:atherin-like [Schistocerca nitens]|uniref:atherin-like n=1 Tax=Schistocerca nitens TaxID=7011 RepID=UPI00211945C7|nr:atherin-like [Schistocerca nitens]
MRIEMSSLLVRAAALHAGVGGSAAPGRRPPAASVAAGARRRGAINHSAPGPRPPPPPPSPPPLFKTAPCLPAVSGHVGKHGPFPPAVRPRCLWGDAFQFPPPAPTPAPPAGQTLTVRESAGPAARWRRAAAAAATCAARLRPSVCRLQRRAGRDRGSCRPLHSPSGAGRVAASRRGAAGK